jgi:uncharacterized protein YjiS (DUF1127 family)
MPITLAERSAPRVGQSAMGSTLPERNSIFSRPLRTVAAWFVRSSQRRDLLELAKNRRLLNDIGLTREQVIGEAVKPFWCR